MKLWLKQTVITLAVILLAVSACLYFFTVKETEGLIRETVRNGERDTQVFCDYLSTLDSTSNLAYDEDDVTRQSLIQFTFANYAHLLQTDACAWSLVTEGRYLYNTSVYDPLAVLPSAENEIAGSRIAGKDGMRLLVSMQKLEVLQTPVTVYRSANIDETYLHIDELTRMAQYTLLGCLLLCGTLLPLILRKTLKPLRKLARVSERIAGGEYTLRSDIRTSDEVGDLSRSFDNMAGTIEEKISDLEDTARRREMLLGALTHEMKTPMTAIIGFSGSLLSMPLTEEARLEAAHEIHEAARRTERLSQKMMQLISMQENPVVLKKRIDTRELLEKVCASMESAAQEKQIELQADVQSETLSGDPDLLFSLLTNLTDNAIKASPEQTAVRLTGKVNNGMQILSVCDQGSGIPADKVCLVTEPFYRVDKARSRKLGGAGLGLSLCRMIAEAHKGQLDIRSTPGRGTIVSMTWAEEDDTNE